MCSAFSCFRTRKRGVPTGRDRQRSHGILERASGRRGVGEERRCGQWRNHEQQFHHRDGSADIEAAGNERRRRGDRAQNHAGDHCHLAGTPVRCGLLPHASQMASIAYGRLGSERSGSRLLRRNDALSRSERRLGPAWHSAACVADLRCHARAGSPPATAYTSGLLLHDGLSIRLPAGADGAAPSANHPHAEGSGSDPADVARFRSLHGLAGADRRGARRLHPCRAVCRVPVPNCSCERGGGGAGVCGTGSLRPAGVGADICVPRGGF